MNKKFSMAAKFLAVATMGLFIGASDASARPGWDLCDGTIDGTWYYKEGRAMRLDVQPFGRGNQVRVLVQQRNGAEWTTGTCVEGRRGARLSFRGQYNFGDVRISRDGYVRGMVSNYGFEGELN